ncbi:MAG: chemotaxis protein CheW [Oscillospiraceae bacterium]|nr:chemotaxis protein CheW [Oscillospiraceae bacterium]
MNESAMLNPNVDTDNLPWLIFSLCNHVYAIHSRYVTSIMVPPDRITPVPDAPDIYRGLTEIRGQVYPILDMRMLFKYIPLETECEQFIELMNEREKDHIEWAKELEKCVREDRDFTLTTDPNACKFGVWYNEYKKHGTNADFSLNKIEKPHAELHQTADLIAETRKMPDSVQKRRRIDELLNLVTEEYVPEIMAIIDEAKRRYRSFYRETMVLLSTGEATLAIVVDKVLAVDTVTMVEGKINMSKIFNSKFFTGVCHNRRVENDILIIDEEKLIAKAEKDVPIDKKEDE